MIIQLLKELEKRGIERIVNTSCLLEEKLCAFNDAFSITFIEDARSAVFTAYGLAKSSNYPAVVIIEDAYLPNVYTGLTEAWFQRIPVIVIALNSTDKHSSEYLDRCVDATYCVDSSSDINLIISNVMQHRGPSLLKVRSEVGMDIKIDYFSIIDLLNSCTCVSNIICYNSNNNMGIENISSDYKYGILSKYVGQLSGGKEAVLCVPEEILALDTNIFNFRNFPSNFRLIVKESGMKYWPRLEGWMKNNKINTIVFRNNDDNILIKQAIDNPPVAILVKK